MSRLLPGEMEVWLRRFGLASFLRRAAFEAAVQAFTAGAGSTVGETVDDAAMPAFAGTGAAKGLKVGFQRFE